MQNQQPVNFTPKSFLKILSILHLALTFGPLFLAVIAYFAYPESSFNYADTSDLFLIVVPLAIFSGIIMGNYLFKKTINDLKQKESLKQKLSGYQSASLIKYAMAEAPALLTLVAFIQTQNLLYLIITAIVIAYLYYLKPSKSTVENDLGLSGEHKSAFSKNDQVID